MHELQQHELSCFLTLTYDDTPLPAGGSLVKEHFQLFMKRLRKYHGRKIRYFHCGEYGDQTGRPHYHAILFGIDFGDKELYSLNDQGHSVYQSGTLDRLWGHGLCKIGAVTFESAAYTARYILKKHSGADAEKHYRRMNPNTGEVITLQPEYVTMSRRPGIGADWYRKYKADAFPSDFVVMNGAKMAPPRFYRKILETEDKKLFDFLKYKRIKEAKKHSDDQTTSRLLVRQECLEARISTLKRNVE